MVVKRNGHREPFDRAKVLAGIRAASKNLAIEPSQIEAIVSEVEEAVRMEGPEIPSAQVGVLVLDRLRLVDGVAYLRFASVYKNFTDPSDFAREVKTLSKASAPKLRSGA